MFSLRQLWPFSRSREADGASQPVERPAHPFLDALEEMERNPNNDPGRILFMVRAWLHSAAIMLLTSVMMPYITYAADHNAYLPGLSTQPYVIIAVLFVDIILEFVYGMCIPLRHTALPPGTRRGLGFEACARFVCALTYWIVDITYASAEHLFAFDMDWTFKGCTVDTFIRVMLVVLGIWDMLYVIFDNRRPIHYIRSRGWRNQNFRSLDGWIDLNSLMHNLLHAWAVPYVLNRNISQIVPDEEAMLDISDHLYGNGLAPVAAAPGPDIELQETQGTTMGGHSVAATPEAGAELQETHGTATSGNPVAAPAQNDVLQAPAPVRTRGYTTGTFGS